MQKCDTAFFNGKIITVDPDDRIVSALGVAGERIGAVGSREEIGEHCDSQTRFVDLKGKTVIPGLIDSHCHLGLTSRSFLHYVDGRCPPNRSISDVLERIREKTKQTPAGELITVHFSMFSDCKLLEKRYPHKEELDSVAPHHPVVILASMHTSIVNSCALRSINVTTQTRELPGGIHIERNPQGDPTGVFKEGSPVGVTPLSYGQFKDTLKRGIAGYWLPQGFTSAYSFTIDGSELRAYQELAAEDSLGLRIKSMFCEFDNSLHAIDNLVHLGIRSDFGNEKLGLGGVKIFVDGAFMSLTAACKTPYLNVAKPGYCGVLRISADRLNAYVKKAHDAGLTLCVHAMGDKAQEMALDAYELALASNTKPHRHRMEHFGCDTGGPQLRKRAKALGIIPNVTPGWLHSYGDFLEKHLGKERSRHSFAFRSMLDDGLKPAASSDQCGTDPMTLDPFHNIWCAVTRQTYFRNRFEPGEAISVKDALKMWTTHAAFSGSEENIKGSLEVGKLADFTVISDDILSIPEERIKDLKVETTIIGGKVVYGHSIVKR